MVGEDDECGLDGVDPAGCHAQRVGGMAGHGGAGAAPGGAAPAGGPGDSESASTTNKPRAVATSRRGAEVDAERVGHGRHAAVATRRRSARCADAGTRASTLRVASSTAGLAVQRGRPAGRWPVHSSSATDSKEVAGTLAPPPTRSLTS